MSDTLSITNPWTGVLADSYSLDSPEAVDGKVLAAHEATAQWRKVPLGLRIELVERFLVVAEANQEDVASLISRQMGKPVREARNEVGAMIGRARTMIRLAPEALADQTLSLDDGISRRIVRDPLGVILDIAAWNYPLLIAINVVAPALLAGNAVLIKHASQTAGVGLWFEDMFRRAGAPDGLVTAVLVRGSESQALVQHRNIDAVFFTGSTEGGQQVYRTVANREHGFVDVGLELGGKDPAYVRADMPVELAAANLIEGAFYNAGQSCCAVERIYVHRARYEAFVEAAVEAAKTWTVGAPTHEASMLGALATAETLDVLDAQVADAVAKGARLWLGGERLAGPGWRYPATVLSDTSHEMSLMRDESFGPIIGIMPVDSDEEALALMNDTAYGLTASIWTSDHRAGEALGRRVRAGTVFVNRCDYVDPVLPWTGLRDSGKGISLSALGFAHLTRARGLHVRPLDMLG
jgi:acyl-CoA reductase-like NAD-dependent aldehyde dehydrogenase